MLIKLKSGVQSTEELTEQNKDEILQSITSSFYEIEQNIINEKKNNLMVDKELDDLAKDIFSHKLVNGRVWVKQSEFNYPDFLKSYGVSTKINQKRLDKVESENTKSLTQPTDSTIVPDKIGMPTSDVFFSTNFKREDNIAAKRAFIAIVFAGIISLTLQFMYKFRNFGSRRYTHPGTGLLLPSRQLNYSRFY